MSNAGCVLEEDLGEEEDEEVADNEEALKAEGAIGGHAFGLGVDADKAMASPTFATLKAKFRAGDAKLSSARIVFYLNEHDVVSVLRERGALPPIAPETSN